MIDINSKYNKDLQEQRSDDKRTLYKKRASALDDILFLL